jgi:ribonuclease HI
MIDIYTDGSCLGNPGKGGWAFALIKNNKLFKIGSGANTDTTNNRME